MMDARCIYTCVFNTRTRAHIYGCIEDTHFQGPVRAVYVVYDKVRSRAAGLMRVSECTLRRLDR